MDNKQETKIEKEPVKDYRSHQFINKLTPGHALNIGDAVYLGFTDISSLVIQGKDAVKKIHLSSIENEQKARDMVIEAFKQWETHAALTQACDRALEYLRTPEVEHSGNHWQRSSDRHWDWVISNRVYLMAYRVREEYRYDKEKEMNLPVSWYVSWIVALNRTKDCYIKDYSENRIVGRDNKRFTDKAAAIKYLEGRKKAYANLFTEISPAIPQKYKDLFSVHGLLLPGYRLEETEN